MDKNAIKKYAVWARRELLSRVAQKALQYGVDGTTPADPDAEIINGRLLTAAEKSQRRALIDAIAADGYEQILEEAAYTWFNRFCALRFMEVNNYLPSHTRVFTDENNAFAPQILAEAIRIELPGLDRDLVYKYKEANDDDALYKYLLITQCNALKEILPGMFSEISGYTELLFPDNLLREGSAVEQMIAMIPEDDWRDEVQIIGWLYQYYNSEKKDAVFAALKKNVKISKDNIPAATQLFTPDWIVRYMVENSLGRLWVQGHPAAPIKREWKYYLEDAAQTPEVEARLAPLRQSYAALTPEQLTCIDPCCGSGHILVYLFDVLMQIYTDYGYTAREAVESIVQNNLYGLDIDKRAAQLAYFAVMMTARRHDRGFLRRPVQPHVYAIAESNAVDKGAVEVFCNGNAKLTAAVAQILTEMHDAREYGSILTTTPQDWMALYARFEELSVNDPDNHSMEKRALLKLQNVVQAAELLSKQYWVTVTNPPYMGSSGMNNDLSAYVKKNYPDSKSDLFAVFMERGNAMVQENGFNCMVTMQSWMFLSSFETMRTQILQTKTITNLMHMENMVMGIAFGTAVTVMQNAELQGYKGTYNQIKLADIVEDEDTGMRRPVSFPVKGNRFAQVASGNFSKIPGSPVAYWVSKKMLQSFTGDNLDNELVFKQGMTTTDNEKYLREWFEVEQNKIGFQITSREESIQSGCKWFPYQKGGNFRKWYGNNEYVVYYLDDGKELIDLVTKKYPKISDPEFIIKNRNWYFKEGLTWSTLSSGSLGVRYCFGGFIFDAKGSMAFENGNENIKYSIALLNSKVAAHYLEILAPTIDYNIVSLKAVPLVVAEQKWIEELTENNILEEKSDWDSFETSWDFKRHPLI